MLLGRRHQRLDDVDVALPTVRVQLHLEAVVAEASDLNRRDADPEGVADRAGKLAVGTAAEDDDLTHEQPLGWTGLVPACSLPRYEEHATSLLVGKSRSRDTGRLSARRGLG